MSFISIYNYWLDCLSWAYETYSSLLILAISDCFWSRIAFNFSLSFFSLFLNSLVIWILSSSFSLSNSSIFSLRTSICNLSYCSTLIWFRTSASYCWSCCSYSLGGKSMLLKVELNPVSFRSLLVTIPIPLLEFKLLWVNWSRPWLRSGLGFLTFSLLSSLICIRISMEVLM